MLERNHLYALAGLAVLTIGVAVGFLLVLPDTVPVHWDIRGEPDRFGSKWEIILLGPIFAIGIPAMLVGLFHLGPLRKNLESSSKILGRIIIVTTAALTCFYLIALLRAYGTRIDVGRAMAVILGIMLALMGNWLGKVRRNFWLGVRTPWTLMNEVVWEKTNRLAGRLFVAGGLVIALSGFIAPAIVCFFVFLGTTLGVCVASTVYSYKLYRKVGEPAG